MGNVKNSSRGRSWALEACDYQNTREIFKTSNPMVHTLLILLIILALFWVEQLLSGPVGEKSPVYTEESPAKTLSDENLPGPNDPVAVDRAPELISAVSPKYPSGALKEAKKGTVWVKALIDTEGIVRDAIIEQESGENAGFEEAALEAATQRKYRPALYEDKPVAAWVSYEVSFQLKKK
jgi:TonB family protein